jgi:hypothetical protein
MPSLPDASLSILAADLQVNSTPWAATGGLLLVVATGSIYYASPQRLTRVLVDAMANVKKAYLEAIENGALCMTDAHTAETFARYAFHPLLFYGRMLSVCPTGQITARGIHYPPGVPAQLPLALCNVV